MKQRKAILLAFLATALAAQAAQRFAVVRVRDIYTNLASTHILQDQIETDRRAIMKDQRAEQLRKIISELQALQAQLSDKKNPPDGATSQKLARAYEIKRQEAQTLQQDFEQFKTEEEKKINLRMVAAMRASLGKIVETSTKIAKDEGFDTLFDSSGNTNTGVAFILVAKDAPDLTVKVEEVLKKTEPPMPAPKPAAVKPEAGTTLAPVPAPGSAAGKHPPEKAAPAHPPKEAPAHPPKEAEKPKETKQYID